MPERLPTEPYGGSAPPDWPVQRGLFTRGMISAFIVGVLLVYGAAFILLLWSHS